MRTREQVQRKLDNVVENTPLWDVLMGIREIIKESPDDVESKVRELLEGANECVCSTCTLDSIVYEWFLNA